jgi:hypothetical protein
MIALAGLALFTGMVCALNFQWRVRRRRELLRVATTKRHPAEMALPPSWSPPASLR